MSMIAIGNLDHAGATVWWTLTEHTPVHALRAAWLAQGLPESTLPPAPSAEQRLGRAVRSCASQRVLARPLARRGHWALVSESVHGEEAAARLQHAQTLTVRLTDNTVIYSDDSELAHTVSRAYAAQDGLLDRDDVALWLVAVVRRLHGTPLRPRGGLYYLLPARVQEWRQVCAALEQSQAGSCYTLPTIGGEDATRAVLDALVRDVGAACVEYGDAVATGTLGTRALRARVADCDTLLERLAQYEGMLGGTLDAVRVQVQSVQDAALGAAFAVEAEAEGA